MESNEAGESEQDLPASVRQEENMGVLQAVNIKKNFSGVQALVNGQLSLSAGRITGLLGANGSGKSTISKIICGIHQPCSGKLIIDGTEILIKSPEQARELGIVMIHQHLSLLPELKVWENIILGHEQCKKNGLLDDKKNRQFAISSLDKMKTDIDPDSQIKNLSPSEKQIVEIAKALVNKPRILILDEPTAALEHSQVHKLFEIMRDLRDNDNTAMVFISHRMHEIVQICDEICVFRNGDTVGFIDLRNEKFDEDNVISMITGKPRRKQESCCCRIDQQSVSVEIDNLQIKGLKNLISLQVKRGEILGLAGLSGQGQEEFLAALAGYRKILSGHVKINGQSAHLSSPRKAIKTGIALVPGDRQEEGVFMDHNIGDNLLFTMRTMSKTGFINKKKEDITRADDLIKQMNIQPQNPNQIIRYLSGGNQQKAVVGKWLNLKPHLLLLSDPAKGVDVDAKEEMYRVIEQVAADGTAVILYASDNAELVRVCHRIAVMYEGQITTELCDNQISDEMITEASLGLV